MVKKIILCFLILFIIFHSAIYIYGEESDLPEGYEDLIDGIPDDIADLLPDSLFSDKQGDLIAAVDEMTSWRYILNIVFDTLGLNLAKTIEVFAILCAILALCALLSMLKKSIKNSALEVALNLVGSAVMLTAILELSKEPLERAWLMLDQVKLFVNTMSPFVCSMYAMGGNVANAVVHNFGLIVYLALLENVCIVALEMILGICMSLAMVGAFMPNTNLASMSNAIKKIFTFFMGFLMLVFTTVISTQTLLASKADSLTSKTAKMFASQMIPVIGGTIGESLRTAGASIEYLRSNIGVALIVILLIMILPSIISITLYRIVFIATHGIAGLLNCEREGTLLLEISSIYGYVLAILSICSIVLLFLITLFAKCSSVLN